MPIVNFLCNYRHKYLKFDLRGTVYKILCKSCTSIYIGETERFLNARLKEYNNYFNKLTLNSRLAANALEYDHVSDFVATQVVQVVKTKCWLYSGHIFQERWLTVLAESSIDEATQVPAGYDVLIKL